MSTSILFLSKDVFFWPVVKGAAETIGCEVVIVSKIDDSKLINLQLGSVECCLIDLNSIEVSQIAAAVNRLRERLGEIRIVAFGPHVQEARLAAAVAAGCSPVLSRGQLTAGLAEYLQTWVKR